MLKQWEDLISPYFTKNTKKVINSTSPNILFCPIQESRETIREKSNQKNNASTNK